MDINKLDWSPLQGGGANYTTRKLKVVSDKKVIFKATLLNYIFPVMFGGIPLIMIVAFTLTSSRPPYFVYLFLSLFVTIGLTIGYFLCRPIVFDLEKGVFYKGRRGKKDVYLKNVEGIQIITEYVVSTSTNNGSTTTSRYHSYEINLVLKDLKRVNVVDHGGKEQIIKDVKTLSKVLNLPVFTKN